MFLLHYTELQQKAQDEKAKKDKTSKPNDESQPAITSAMEKA